MPQLITLTTDFGTTDGYLASMKGVIFSLAPSCRIVDVTHEIEPQDVRQAGIVLAIAAPYFPPGTIHVAVVDPGVGTERALLAVAAGEHIYLAPDNGLLGIIFERHPDLDAYRIENRSLFLPRVSHTFHGRDILAPVAAHLAMGVRLSEVGPPVKEFDRGVFSHAVLRGNSLIGQIIYRDRFGNLFTNITQDDLNRFNLSTLRLRAGYTRVDRLSKSYSEVEKGELLCLVGSGGFLEIALREGSAGDKLRFPLGTEVEVQGDIIT